MALIADSGALYALYDASDRHHRAVRSSLEAERGPIIVPVTLLAEVDYLLRRFLGVDAELDFLDAILAGSYILEPIGSGDLARCKALIAKYRDLDLGLADTAVIATAERLGIFKLLTIDLRHFRAVRSSSGQPFTLLPSDRDGERR